MRGIAFIIIFCVCLLSTSAKASIGFLADPYIAFGFGGADLNETDTSTSTSYDHDAFLMGLELGLRAGLEIGALFFGGVGNVSIWQNNGTRKETTTGTLSSSAYDNTYQQILYGALFGFQLAKAKYRLWGEYYPKAKLKATYAESKAANFLTKDDTLDGTGFGVGFGVQMFESAYGALVVRRIDYDQLTIDSVSQNFPNSEFSKYRAWQASFQAGFLFH